MVGFGFVVDCIIMFGTQVSSYEQDLITDVIIVLGVEPGMHGPTLSMHLPSARTLFMWSFHHFNLLFLVSDIYSVIDA